MARELCKVVQYVGQPYFFRMTINEFNSLTARNRLVLVDFYATWCGPCKAMHPILDAIEQQFGSSVDVLRVDVDQYESVGLVQHFRVMSVPTLMFFRRGRMLWRNSGMVTLETLVDIIRRYDRVEVY